MVRPRLQRPGSPYSLYRDVQVQWMDQKHDGKLCSDFYNHTEDHIKLPKSTWALSTNQDFTAIIKAIK